MGLRVGRAHSPSASTHFAVKAVHQELLQLVDVSRRDGTDQGIEGTAHHGLPEVKRLVQAWGAPLL